MKLCAFTTNLAFASMEITAEKDTIKPNVKGKNVMQQNVKKDIHENVDTSVTTRDANLVNIASMAI